MLKTAGVSGSIVSGSGWSDCIVTSFYRDYIQPGYIHVGDTNMRSQGCQALGLSGSTSFRILLANPKGGGLCKAPPELSCPSPLHSVEREQTERVRQQYPLRGKHGDMPPQGRASQNENKFHSLNHQQ